MAKLTVFCTVLAVLINLIENVKSDGPDTDLKKVLKYVQHQLEEEEREQQRYQRSQLLQRAGQRFQMEDEGTEETTDYGSLKNEEVQRILQQVAQHRLENDRNKKQKNRNDDATNRGNLLQNEQRHFLEQHLLNKFRGNLQKHHRSPGHDSNPYQLLLNKLNPETPLDYGSKHNFYKHQPDAKHRHRSDRGHNKLQQKDSGLLDLLKRNDDQPDDEFTRVYVVLDADTLKKDNSKMLLKNLFSSIFTSLPNVEERVEDQKLSPFGNFLLKDDLTERRMNHIERTNRVASKEFSRDRDESSGYRPPSRQKSRSHQGGGGRTAIPHVGQRGDVYEKE